MDTAEIFWSGRSQAVRLPKDFRFDATEVRIRRQGASVVLEPIDWDWLEGIVGSVDADFAEAALAVQDEQQRPELDHFK